MSTPEGQTTKFDQCTSVANFTREGFAGEDPMNKQTKILAGAFLFFWGGGGVGAAVVGGRSDDTPLPCPNPRVAGDYCCYQGSLFSSEMARLEAAFVNVNRLGAVVVAEHVSDSLQVRVDGGRGCFHAESAHAPAVHRSTWRTCSTGTARTQRLARRRCPPRWRLSHPPSCGS